MIADLKPYPKMKDSGVTWLGKVPEHWKIWPLGRLLAERKEKNNPIKTTNILSLSLTAGVIPYADKKPGGNKAKEDLSAYMLAYPGDIVLNSMNVVVGSVGLSKYFGAVSPVYYMLHPRRADDRVEYFNAIFQSSVFQRSLFGLGNGIMYIESKSSGKLNTIRLRIPMEKLNRVQLPHPPPSEQHAIVRFLDYMDRRIRKYIRSKQKLIKLLEEQKQAIIHRAVTRGLDPNVRLKPSGVEWLGDVPEHWEVRKLKRLARINPSRSEAIHLRDSTKLVTFLPMERVSTKGEVDTTLQLPIRNLWQGFTYFRRGDVLLAKITPCFENGKGACLTSLPTDVGFGTTEFIVLRAGMVILPEFLYKVTQLAIFRSIGVESMTGSAGQQRIAHDFVANFKMPVPPLTEQVEIQRVLLEESRHIDSAIAHSRAEITLLGEYRTRLIADVVTGKLDVREVASKLPDEPYESFDETDALSEADETAFEDIDATVEEVEA